jgi:4-carboxymuconolactone decarboxylase
MAEKKHRHKKTPEAERIQDKFGYVPLVLTSAGKIDEEIGGDLQKVLSDMYEDVWKDGALPRKYKHLIALSIALVERQEGQTLKVLDKARRAGASEEEIYETLKLVLWLRGVPSFVHGERILAGMMRR